jgi:hypothetical protein
MIRVIPPRVSGSTLSAVSAYAHAVGECSANQSYGHCQPGARLKTHLLLLSRGSENETWEKETMSIVHTTVDGTFRQTNLTNEPSEYLTKREELRLAEIELMRQRERVAEMRRHLPQGAAIQDYSFEEGPRDLNAGDAPVRTVHLRELFTKPNRSHHLSLNVRKTAKQALPHVHCLARRRQRYCASPRSESRLRRCRGRRYPYSARPRSGARLGQAASPQRRQ